MLPLLLSRYLFEKHRLGPAGCFHLWWSPQLQGHGLGGHLDASLRSRESDDQAIESGGSGQQAHNTHAGLAMRRQRDREGEGHGVGGGREGMRTSSRHLPVPALLSRAAFSCPEQWDP